MSEELNPSQHFWLNGTEVRGCALMNAHVCVLVSFLRWRANVKQLTQGCLSISGKTLNYSEPLWEASLAPRQGGVFVTHQSKYL